MRCLNVIWRRRVLDDFLEAQFIRTVLLSRLARPIRWTAIEDDAELPLSDDLLVCSFGDPGGYLENLRAAGHRNIGVFHFGDERGSDDTSFYGQADYIFRHYYFSKKLMPPGGFNRDVLWLPNGWARGVGPMRPAALLPFAMRRHGVFFAGFAGGTDDPISERAEMLNALQAHQIPATVVLSEGFGQGLGPGSYGAYMSDAKLALVPGGNSPETIRLYDALECGALPVVLNRAWLAAPDGLGVLGPPPLPVLQTWQDLPDAIADFLGARDRDGLEHSSARAVACRQWWGRIKDHCAERVAAVIETAFAGA